MRKLKLAEAVFLAASIGTAAVAGSHTEEMYAAKELMQTCVAADNDARDGPTFEIECEQYITGFVQALELTGQAGPGTEICPPQVNMPDEVRWAFTRWIHGDFRNRVSLSAADALLATLKEEFGCS